LHAAMNHHSQDERLRFYEAIEMYTDNNAWLAQEQSVLGKIAPGFVADLSVMDTDFTAPFDYQASKTLLIFRNGNIVYAAG
ncbi:MAG TPA: amidohydrolase family protein, partial [Candidatus Syntrophosphaera sp.]|nr:amidohydrolase family protein [Candidatus Syntrophosphaera sp.]